jgi:DNA-binding response OmpR family regulator
MDSAPTAPLNILVIEDHDDLRAATVSALTGMGYRAHGVDCSEAMDEALVGFPADILLLDLNLPGEDGLSIARRLRAAQPEIGIIMVTARNRAQDVMTGYGNGADIYVAKPVSPEELDAAIRALTRRIKPAAPPAGQLRLDTQGLCLISAQATVNLSDNECHLLAALAKAQDRRLETWQLLEVLGKETDELEKRALTVQIVRLRKKFEQAGVPEPTLKAIRGTGYQLCVSLRIDSGSR